ncbi:MAG TPA: ATP-binding cassette domain-containing protein [Thermoguttaceae bacterium]|nr:ATP-binding cassette domain-containing protein [Thermoguttaceae bacterium]
MPLVAIRELSIGFRGPSLLDGVTCQMEPGERIGLLGPNGAGKTTLLRMLTGHIEPDHGEIVLAQGTKVSLLPQEVPLDITGRVFDVVLAALPDDHLEEQWKNHQRVEQTLARMQLNADQRFECMSSGMRRRVLLARAIVSEPDLLLLDEPTNHLDIEAITWLEEFMARWPGTLIFVTHDRVFLRKLARRILEIDRGRLFDWTCDYDTFVARKEAALEAEEKQNALFDKRLAQEEKWIRQGVLARRTRNEGRVRALKEMRQVRAERRSSPANVRLAIQEGRRSGNLVAEVNHISFAYGDRQIVCDFSTAVMRGDKIGVIGPNGAGKTTLLRLLLGQLPPSAGSVRLGGNLQVAYFDQLREQLNEERTVQENVGDGYDVVAGPTKARHVLGYLKNFLFSPERARTPVRFLSGGERNRVLLAKLFAKPANVIVLDEPTNDLDTETLELLESRLVDFQGTVLLVSHDRQFLNNVVTGTLVFEDGTLREYVGGYDDWQRQRAARPSETTVDERPKRPSASTASTGKRRLTYKEKLELAELPQTIERLDAQITQWHDRMAQPAFYQQPGEQIARQQAELKEIESQLADAYHRWEELDKLAK